MAMAAPALPFAAIGMQALGSIMQGMQSSQNYGMQANVAKANAAYDVEEGNAAFMSAADARRYPDPSRRAASRRGSRGRGPSGHRDSERRAVDPAVRDE